MTSEVTPKEIIGKKEEPADPSALTLYQLQEVVPQDVPRNLVLTYVVNIDEHVAILERDLKALEAVRSALMRRVTKEEIEEDAFAMVVKIPGKLYRNPISGPERIKAFAMQFPGEYLEIRTKQSDDIWAAANVAVETLPDSDVPLGLADASLGKEAVTAFTGHKPQQITLEVRKKPPMALR
jgi:hypothetical protein